MEDVSTGVLEIIKNIQEVKIKPKKYVMYQETLALTIGNFQQFQDTAP